MVRHLFHDIDGQQASVPRLWMVTQDNEITFVFSGNAQNLLEGIALHNHALGLDIGLGAYQVLQGTKIFVLGWLRLGGREPNSPITVS